MYHGYHHYPYQLILSGFFLITKTYIFSSILLFIKLQQPIKDYYTTPTERQVS